MRDEIDAELAAMRSLLRRCHRGGRTRRLPYAALIVALAVLGIFFRLGQAIPKGTTRLAAAAPEFELIVGPRPGPRDDGMTGTHALRTKTITLRDGRTVIVGCVPCLNALTYIAIVNGRAYAASGLARDWVARYSIRSGGITMKVRDENQGPREDLIIDTTPVFDAIELIKGCNLPGTDGFAHAIAEAVLGHQCLGE